MKKMILNMAFLVTQNMMAQTASLSWAKSFSGSNQEVSKSVAVDPAGNIYTTGYFLGTVDFNPGPAAYLLSSGGQQDIFITKLNGSGNFIWAKRIGGVGNEIANSITLDTSGNIYVTGFFRNTVDFNPGTGIFNISSATAASQDIFILKLDSSGNFVWAKSFGGTGYYDTLGNSYDAVSVGYAIKTDVAGNVYTTGSFLGTIDFNPGIGIDTLSALHVSNIFISKLNASGNFLWAKQTGENKQGDEAYAITLDNAGNIYTTGVFSDTADFDPGPSTYNLITHAYNAAFVSKSDSNGNFVWAKKTGGTTSNDQAAGLSISTDVNGNVYTAGKFKGSGDFDPSTGVMNLNSNGNYDMYISKLNNAGDFLWAKSVGGTNSDICYSITTDVYGTVYATGSFKGTVDFNPDIDTSFLSSASLSTLDIFLMKLNTNGDFIYASKMGGTGNDQGNAIELNTAGSIFITGYYTGTADFDPGQDVNNLLSQGGLDAFIIKLNQNNMILPLNIIHFSAKEVQTGNLLKCETENEINTDYVEIQKSPDGRNFSAIDIIESPPKAASNMWYYFLDDHPLEGINYYRLKFADKDDQYLYSKIISITNGHKKNGIYAFPNPCSGQLTVTTIQLIKKGRIRITDSEGQIVLERFSIEGRSFSFDLSFLPDGIYFIELNEEAEDAELTDKKKKEITCVTLLK